MRSPLVIVDGSKKFQYMVSSIEDTDAMVDNLFMVMCEPENPDYSGNLKGSYIVSKTLEPMVRMVNYWCPVKFSCSVDCGFPESIHRRTLQIDIPDFNPSVYSKVEYVVDVSTRIGLTKIVLACVKFGFDDLLSLPVPYRDGQHKYHQYFTIDILDPWDLCYSDDFYEFRTQFCNEYPDTNNCGALLDIEITAVTQESGELIPDVRYSTGRNLILLSERDSDHLSLSLVESAEGWKSSLLFNTAFDGDLKTYLSETYFFGSPDSPEDYIVTCIPEIVIMDKDSIYKILDLNPIDLTNTSTVDTVEFSESSPELIFGSWSDWLEGMYATATLRLFNGRGEEVMDLRSNAVPVTKSKFRFLVGDEITIEDMDITVEKLDVVNKIQKNIVKVNRPDDYKSNIIRPVFYKSFPLEEIDIHDSVTFTLSIDLDSYKSKSDSFSVQIEGKNFQEIGRVPGGVLFKIYGNELPHQSDSGKYYILDTNQELVAEGNYRYI